MRSLSSLFPAPPWLAAMAVAAVSPFLGACRSPAKIEVTPERPMITRRAGTVTLAARVKDASGRVIEGAKVTFRSLTPTIINADEVGRVSAIRSGQGQVLVTSGKASLQVPVLVQIPKRIAIDPDSPMIMLGVSRAFKATVYTDRNEPMIAGEATWESSDPSIFTVDARGNVKTLKEGEATLTVRAAGISGSTKITVKHEVLNEDGTLTQ